MISPTDGRVAHYPLLYCVQARVNIASRFYSACQRDLIAPGSCFVMASAGYLQAAVLLLALQLLVLGAADAEQETGTVIPAESRWITTTSAFFKLLLVLLFYPKTLVFPF